MAAVSANEIHTRLNRFIESSPSEHMPDAAAALLELIEQDEVEALGPGKPAPAEDFAERLEVKVARLRRRDDPPEGLDLLEDVVAHLRGLEDDLLAPHAFEDSEGVRWFILSRGNEVVACYTSRPFLEAEG
ncbi:MAG: hypothetical protein HY791_39275 [Deltaproteobacteria bacterium]|nr:hypothetical protein [Deltaproteobacteria bacterium]